MCGIAGQIQLDGKAASRQSVHAMLEALSHRGPSGEGVYSAKSVVFGMRRLSIIDVAGGDQPLYTEDKSVVIIGNGEIYNYKELQRLLIKRGHALRTGSDIETIAHLYEDEGVKCLHRLRGMFAICLYDVKKRKVFIARDRLGEKPIYWTRIGSSIAFASEMKALLQFPRVPKKIQIDACRDFFSFYFIPEPYTAIAGISKIPAGAYVTIDINSGETQEKKYWDASQVEFTNDDFSEKVARNLNEIGKITTRSDVPVGISLSGGFDSTAVLALASRHSTQLKAFAVGYHGKPATDERDVARRTAEFFGVEYIEDEITKKEMIADFPKTVFAGDDPIADIAAYPIYRVAKLAQSQGVPVLLSGVGGDELFWGYPWMREAVDDMVKSKSTDAKFYERSAGFPRAQSFLSLVGTPDIMKSSGILLRHFHPNKKTKKAEGFGRFAIEAILGGWLLGDCITLGDRMSMAASVELRLPLLDYKLVESALASRKSLLGFARPQKESIKRIMADVIPNEVVQKKKQGFTPPVFDWMTAILGTYYPLLLDGYLVQEGLLSSSRVKLMKFGWRALPQYWYHLYSLLVLEIWCRTMLGGETPEQLSVKG